MGGELKAASEQVSAAYCFGPFRLEPDSGLLLRGGQPVALTPKTFGALVHLVERSGRLVTKDELMRTLWSDAVVSEANLTQTIFMLRKALNENGQRYIATVPGRGYRFEAEVRRSSGNDSMLAAVQQSEPARGAAAIPAEEPARLRTRGGIRRRAAAAVAILAVLATGALFAWWHYQPRLHPPAAGRVMLAVLPFQNLTGDPGQEYFSDGLTEEMLSRLGNLDPQHLGVIARTSVMHYKGSAASLDQIGRELGVEYVIEGSVRRDGERVRISAQLIRVRDQSHLWARQYDRELKGLLTLQEEVAQEIADETEVSLGARRLLPPESLPRDDAAYDFYLKGQYHFNKRTVPGFQEAIRYFEQALAEDPGYARAWAGMADSWALMAGYGGRPQSEYMAKARGAALKAVECDPNLAEAHTALALVVQNYDLDWAAAEREFRRAIELNPNYATAHHWYAEHLMWRGRFDEALAESERARQLDPLSLIIATDNGAILYYSRQYDKAIAKWRSVLEMDAGFPRAHLIRYAYAEKRMVAEALADIEAQGQWPKEPWYWCSLAVVYGRSGNKAQGRHALDELLELNQHTPVDPQLIADAYAGVGEKDQALGWLERAFAQRSVGLVSLGVDPLYDSLRSDPRFANLVRKAGLGG